jgi:hypothetical protein
MTNTNVAAFALSDWPWRREWDDTALDFCTKRGGSRATAYKYSLTPLSFLVFFLVLVRLRQILDQVSWLMRVNPLAGSALGFRG